VHVRAEAAAAATLALSQLSDRSSHGAAQITDDVWVCALCIAVVGS
jgi:hypothetical protein